MTTASVVKQISEHGFEKSRALIGLLSKYWIRLPDEMQEEIRKLLGSDVVPGKPAKKRKR